VSSEGFEPEVGEKLCFLIFLIRFFFDLLSFSLTRNWSKGTGLTRPAWITECADEQRPTLGVYQGRSHESLPANWCFVLYRCVRVISHDSLARQWRPIASFGLRDIVLTCLEGIITAIVQVACRELEVNNVPFLLFDLLQGRVSAFAS